MEDDQDRDTPEEEKLENSSSKQNESSEEETDKSTGTNHGKEEESESELDFDSDLTILLVEDREHIQKIVRHFLEEEGIELLQTTDANSAEQVLKDYKVDLLILDIMLPEKDGITFLKELKSKKDYKDLPILMMSARRDKKAVVQSVTSGASDYILKPFDKDLLLEKISNCLDN